MVFVFKLWYSCGGFSSNNFILNFLHTPTGPFTPFCTVAILFKLGYSYGGFSSNNFILNFLFLISSSQYDLFLVPLVSILLCIE